MKLSVVTPEKALWLNTVVTDLIVPGYLGELNILDGHAPLMTVLSTGVLRFKVENSDKETSIAISWGYLEVYPGGVNVLAETAEMAQDIDIERAKNALKKAELHLLSDKLTEEEIEKCNRKIERSLVRQSVYGSNKS